MPGFDLRLGHTSSALVLAVVASFAACIGSSRGGGGSGGSGGTGAGGSATATTSGENTTTTGGDAGVSIGSVSSASSAAAGTGGADATTTIAVGVTASATASGSGGSGGSGGSEPIAGNTILGKVTYPGVVGPSDVLHVVSLKNAQPTNPGASIQIVAPVFPLNYEIDNIETNPDTGTWYGILAYIDIGGNNPMLPGTEDPRVLPPTFFVVSPSAGVRIDLAIP